MGAKQEQARVKILSIYQDSIESGNLTTCMEAIGTVEAAKRLKISRDRVVKLIYSGRLPAQKFGNYWAINPADLELVKDRRPGWKKGRSRNEYKAQLKDAKSRDR